MGSTAQTTPDPRGARVLEMRRQGLTLRRIAAEFGVSRPTLRRWCIPGDAEQSRRLSREAKRRRRGVCQDCGAPTSYKGRDGEEFSPRCRACSNIAVHAARTGNGATQKRVLALIDPARPFMEIARELDMPKEALAQHLYRLIHHGRIERVARGRYRRIEATNPP